MYPAIFKKLINFTICLALFVIMLGAYTRLTDAGLGCPDWPGCYGKIVLPHGALELKQAQKNYPLQPIEFSKAWTEMIHRYVAGILAVLVFGIGITLLNWRIHGQTVPYLLPLGLMGLIVLQAVLGMWTVTMQLKPLIVMAHLLGGILIFSGLSCLRLLLSANYISNKTRWHLWTGIAAVIVFVQIIFGALVSSNYAALVCIGFPKCNGHWMFGYGNLVTIHMLHRLWAVVTVGYLGLLMWCLLKNIAEFKIKVLAWLSLILVMLQFLLGVINVVYLLPLSIAVLHNGVAAILMAMTMLLFCLT